MPTYDYRCERTREMFEMWQSFSDDALTVCPETHDGESDICGAPVKKVFSKVGISFKGDGFYKNDHGASAGKSAGTESSESSTTSSSSDSSSSSTTSSSSESKNSSGSSNTSGASDSSGSSSSD